MVRHNIKLFAWLIVILTLLLFFGLYILQIRDSDNLNPMSFFKLVSSTVTGVTFLGFLFNRYMWRWPVFTYMHWFIKVPYLAGKWEGTLKYYWDNQWKEKPMEINIKQTFLHIQVSIKTNESWSKTIGGTFDVDEDNGFNSLIYTYLNTPDASVRNRSTIHYGTAILSIEKDMKTLRGNYFTDRKTTGEMVFHKL